MSTGGTKEKVLAAYLAPEKKAFIQARGRRLDWTDSKYAARIVDWWIAAGAPGVHEIEAALPPLTYDQFFNEWLREASQQPGRSGAKSGQEVGG